jgi:hypothetical protein
LYKLFLYLEVWIVLSFTHGFVSFWFFWIAVFSQDSSEPEQESSLLPKRRVCILSDNIKNPNTQQ